MIHRRPDWEFLIGDLAESRAARRRAGAGWRADLWFARQWIAAFITHRLRRTPAADRTLMRHLMQDIRFAGRLFAANRMFTAIAVLSLAVAIGANALVYGVVDALILNPFPFADSDRLVSVGSSYPKLDDDEGFVERHSPAEIDDFRTARSLTNVTAFDLGNRSVSNGDALAERYFTALVLDDPFPALRQTPVLGRGFTREELQPDGPAVVIFSHRLWRTLFNADPGIVGKAVIVNGTSRVVVGVAPDGPQLLGTDVWIPWGDDTRAMPRNQRQFTVIARLAPGASLASATAELGAIAARIERDHVSQFPEYQGWRLRAATWSEAVAGDARPAGWLLLGAAAFVLLLACANLAGLMLARIGGRQREFSLRLALGAGRGRLVRLLIVESLLLALAGGAIGLALAAAGLQWVVTLVPPAIVPTTGELDLSVRLFVFGFLVSVVAAVAVAIIPAWQATRTDPQASLRDGVTHTGGRTRQRTRALLVVAEVVMAVVLLTGASLLLRSFVKLRQVDPGFDAKGVITMRLTLAWERYQGDPSTVFFRQLVERIEALPGVTAAAAASQFPPSQSFTVRFEVEGRPPEGGALPNALGTVISPGYFKVLGLRLIAGRLLDHTDRSGPVRVVVNRAFAEQFLDGQMTGRLRLNNSKAWTDIVGVVSDARNVSLTKPAEPEIFALVEQAGGTNQLFVLARTSQDPMALLPAIRGVMREMDPQQPLYNIQTLEDAMWRSVFEQRLTLTLLELFAAIALSLACVGVYGMVSFSVASRTREIGIRMALGADRSGVIRMIVKQSVALVGIGTIIGVAGALSLGRFVESLLYDTASSDPIAIGGVIVLLAAVALVAGYLPARRAGRLDPARALRMD